jgi:hypothetical protein
MAPASAMAFRPVRQRALAAQPSVRQTRRRAAEPGDPMAHADPRIDAI